MGALEVVLLILIAFLLGMVVRGCLDRRPGLEEEMVPPGTHFLNFCKEVSK